MKQVLILDAPPLFRDFLKAKLTAEKIHIEIAESRRDAFTKMIKILPDLIIIDAEKTLYDAKDFLERKIATPNTKNIPVVISGPILPAEEIDDLVQYGVVKYFHKPIRFDIFFDFLSRNLRVAFSLDTTPCILEIHVNNDLVFIEVAQGLNRDKLALLKYKIPEVLDSTKLLEPKVIIMMTDLTLSFVDGTNLEALFDAVLDDKRIKAANVKVLSFDSFTKDLIAGHQEYQGISIATSLQSVLYSVVDNTETADMAEFINDNILSSTADISQGSLEMVYKPDEVGKEEFVQEDE
ncbi:MAG: response regulator, partial [Treponemataceae bacterium]|nr:response regulator [Treponemataceae bacterium]